MERVTIPHDPGPRKSNVPPAPAWGRDRNGHLFIRCDCGLCMSLDDHTVEANGDVNPSLHHDADDAGCGWHVYGRLEGYTP